MLLFSDRGLFYCAFIIWTFSFEMVRLINYLTVSALIQKKLDYYIESKIIEVLNTSSPFRCKQEFKKHYNWNMKSIVVQCSIWFCLLCLNTVIELSSERSRVEVGERCPQALPCQLRTDQETRKGQRILRKDGCGITGNFEL